MKARVYVSLKSTVLDAQGKTVRSALAGLGYHSVADVRQGKYFELAIEPGVSAEQARGEVELLARDVLTNPVIETCRVEFEE
jgi:phosphoribosylformylglycinamidine synthase